MDDLQENDLLYDVKQKGVDMSAFTASSACFNNCSEMACDKYSSPQLSQISAGTSFTTIVVSPLSSVAVIFPGCV
jgi:hypothetical protein